MGREKTLNRIRPNFVWDGLASDVRDYVRTCGVCQWTKGETHATRDLLHPVPAPDGKWSHITMDLVTCLPTTPEGHDTVVVFTDRLTKMVRFIPTTVTVTATGLACFFVEHIFRHFGLPTQIVSDCDPCFMGNFW